MLKVDTAMLPLTSMVIDAPFSNLSHIPMPVEYLLFGSSIGSEKRVRVAKCSFREPNARSMHPGGTQEVPKKATSSKERILKGHPRLVNRVPQLKGFRCEERAVLTSFSVACP